MLACGYQAEAQLYIELKAPATSSPCREIPIEVTLINDHPHTVIDEMVEIQFEPSLDYLRLDSQDGSLEYRSHQNSILRLAIDQLEPCESTRAIIWFSHPCLKDNIKVKLSGQLASDDTGTSTSEIEFGLYRMGLGMTDLQVLFDSSRMGFIKRFKIVNSGQIFISDFQMFLTNDDRMDIHNTNCGVLSSDGDSLYFSETDFQKIGNGNGFFEPGEFLEIIQDISLNACDREFDLAHRILVDCGTEACVFDLNAGASLLVLIGTPRLIVTNLPGELSTPCSEGIANIQLTNYSPNGDFEAGKSLYDLILNIGWSRIQGGTRSRPLKDNCIEILDASIGGKTLTLISGGFTGYGIRFSNLSMDPDGPGGLSDIDGDGQFDDLSSTDTAVIQIRYRLNPGCLNYSCSGEVFASRILRMESEYKDYCDEPFDRSQLITGHQYIWSRQYGSVSGVDAFYSDLERDTLRINLNRTVNGFLNDCVDDSMIVRISLPRVVEFEAGAEILVNNQPHPYIHSGNFINLVIRGIRNNIQLPIKLHCEQGSGSGGVNTPCTFCQGSGFPKHRISVTAELYCKGGCRNRIPMFCFSSSQFSAVCDGGGSGTKSDPMLVTNRIKFKRKTLGYKDSSEMIKVQPELDSLNQIDLMTFDEFEIQVPFDIRCNANFSQIFMRLIQRPYFTGSGNNRDTSYAIETFSDTLKFYDSETDRWHYCINPLGPQYYHKQGGGFANVYMRDLRLDPLFSSCLSDGLSVGDSLVLTIQARIADIYTNQVQRSYLRTDLDLNQDGCAMESGTIKYFNIFTGIPFKGQSFLNQEYIQDSLFKRYYTEASVCGGFTFEYYFDNFYSNTVENDPFPNEFRKAYKIDRLKFVVPPFFKWDPSSALYIREYFGNSGIRRIVLSDTVSISGISSDSSGYTLIEFPEFLEHADFNTIRHKLVFNLIPDCYGFIQDTIHSLVNYQYQLQAEDPAQHEIGYVHHKFPVNVSGVAPEFGEPSVQLLKDSVQVWDFNLYSLTHAYVPERFFTYKHVWLSFQNPSGLIVIDSLVETLDSGTTQVIQPQYYPNGLEVYFLDSLYLDRKFKLYTHFKVCGQDSLIVYTGNRCSGYPDFNSNVEDYCHTLRPKLVLDYYPEAPRIDATYSIQPTGPQDGPCQVFDYEVSLTNNGLGHAFKNVIQLHIPFGMNLLNATLELESNTQFNLPLTPIILPERIHRWQIDSFIGLDGLAGFYLTDENKLKLKLKLEGDCSLEEGSQVSVSMNYRSICRQQHETEKIASLPLEFVDPPIPPDPSYTLDVQFEGDTSCQDPISVIVKLKSISELSAKPGQKLYFSFKKELRFVDLSLEPIYQFSSSQWTVERFEDWEILEIPLETTISKGDSMMFKFKMEKTCLAPCKTTDFKVDLNVPVQLPCMASTCDQLINGQSWTFNDVILGPQFRFVDHEFIIEKSVPGMEIINLRYLVENLSPFSSSVNFKWSLIFDANANGKYDANDIFVNQFPMDGKSVPAWDQKWLEWSQSVPSEFSCGLLLLIELDDNPCLCLSDTLLLSPTYIKPRSQDHFVCAGQQLQVGWASDPAYQYQWSPDPGILQYNGSTAEYQIADYLTPGTNKKDTLYLYAEKSSGCAVVDTVYVENYRVKAGLDITDSIKCHGDANASISAWAEGPFGGWNYVWPGNIDTGRYLSQLDTGSYRVIVTDPNGCADTAEIHIDQPSILEDSLSILTNYNGYDIRCHGGNDGRVEAVVNGGTAGYQYRWVPSRPNEPTVADLESGWVHVTVTDANGCEVKDSLFLDEPAPIHFMGGTEPSGCDSLHGGRALVAAWGGVPGYDYLWETGHQGSELFPIPSGYYEVTVTDGNGCEADTLVYVDQLPSPDIDVNIYDSTVLYGNQIVLKAWSNAQGGTFNWKPSSEVSCDTCSTVRVVPTDNLEIWVVVTDEFGCQDSVQIRVKVRIDKKSRLPM